MCSIRSSYRGSSSNTTTTTTSATNAASGSRQQHGSHLPSSYPHRRGSSCSFGIPESV